MKLSRVLLSAVCSGLVGSVAGVLSIEYFDDVGCVEDLYGIQVDLSQCFRQVGAQGNGSAIALCSDVGGLTIQEYANSVDCSTAVTNTVTVATGFTSGSTCLTSFSTNDYIPSFSGGSARINCGAAVEWFTAEDGRYELSRQTTSLESASALDYTQDDCVENSYITEMYYCYLNGAGENCLPSNSDADDDTFCSAAALTTYAYGSSCIFDWSNNYNVQYWSDNNKAGYMNRDCSGDFDDDRSIVFPYSDCVGCNRFKDLKDDSNTGLLVGVIVGIVIGVCVCCFICCAAIFVLMYGTAALTAALCCRRNKHSTAGAAGQNQPSPSVVTTPMHSQPAAQVQYATHAPQVEMLHVQVPPGATPGTMIIVSKSTGEQVQVIIPEGVVPGQIMEVKA